MNWKFWKKDGGKHTHSPDIHSTFSTHDGWITICTSCDTPMYREAGEDFRAIEAKDLFSRGVPEAIEKSREKKYRFFILMTRIAVAAKEPIEANKLVETICKEDITLCTIEVREVLIRMCRTNEIVMDGLKVKLA